MHAIKTFYELPREGRPEPKDCIFLATHEPCSLCLSGITWCGLRQFLLPVHVRGHARRFNIPHDIRILKEVYAVPDPDREEVAPGRDLYNRSNAYFESHYIQAMIGGLDRGNKENLTSRVDDLSALYASFPTSISATRARRVFPSAKPELVAASRFS